MGGHGGLNILPQKRWNVYNRENRLKVAQDEAKAKQQEDEARERHEQAEREHRHRQLLGRAAGDSAQQGHDGGPSAAQGEHINFWREEEAMLQQQHPENEKQKRDEVKRRGNPDFYTSDAKFDERFALAYGLDGDKPWYAQAQKREPPPAAGGPGSAAVPPGPVGLLAARGAAPASPALAVSTLAGAPRPTGEPLRLQRPEEAHKDKKRRRSKQRRRGRGSRRRRRSDSEAESDSSGSSSSSSEFSTSDSSSSSDDSSDDSSTSSSDVGSSDSSSSDSDDDSGGRGRAGRRERRRRSSRSTSPERRRRHSSGKRRRKRRRHASPSTESDSSGDDRKRKRRHSSSTKGRKSRSSKSGSKSRSKRDDAGRQALPRSAGSGPSKSIEQLRAERLLREKAERMKERGLVASTAVLPDGPPEKDYNSAFGFAAVLKRRRTK